MKVPVVRITLGATYVAPFEVTTPLIEVWPDDPCSCSNRACQDQHRRRQAGRAHPAAFRAAASRPRAQWAFARTTAPKDFSLLFCPYAHVLTITGPSTNTM